MTLGGLKLKRVISLVSKFRPDLVLEKLVAMSEDNKIDWENLCETPFVKLGHRVALMLLIPIMLGVGWSFVQMYTAVIALPAKLARIEARQDRLSDRMDRGYDHLSERLHTLEQEMREDLRDDNKRITPGTH